MPPTTYLSEKLVDRLKLVRSTKIGTLYGIYYDNSVLILGLSFEDYERETDGKGGRNGFGSSQAHYPTEVDYCGLVSFQSDTSTDNEQLDFIKKSVEEVSISDAPFVSLINVSAPYPPTINLYCYKSKILEPLDYKILSEKEIKKQFITVRLCSKLPLTCEKESESINEGISNLQKKISAANVMFNIPEHDLFLSDFVVEYNIENLSLESSIADFFEESTREESSSKSKKKGKSSLNELLTTKMLLKSTKSDEENDSQPSGPPIVCQVKHETECLEIFLELDALSVVHVKKKLKHLQNILVDSVLRALSLIKEALVKNASSAPVMHHYSLSQLSHFFTLVYPEKVLEDTLKIYRESIHKLLGLPTNQPFFRRGNAHQFDKKEVQNFSSLLINPHEGLSPSGVSKGEVAIVSGKYSYHHYLQDDINDNGWGCAYRSLQLIVSWFRLQGFTNHSVPSHEEIQKCLVQIGDKPQSFVGSRQWIGSTEISFCLESMLGVTSRIIAINSGEELSERGSELIHHFKTQGTPIMIGGGVLAHTIIGVHFNNQTGNIKLLIVDPHYVGSEDLKTIQDKGWVGWQPVSFWQKNTFYNLCLPLKPTCV